MRSAHSAFTPYLKRPLAPSNDPTSESALPLKKRRRIDTSGSGGKFVLVLGAGEQRTRDAILQRLRADPLHLDLSGFSIGELMALPASAIGAATAQVTQLQLPGSLPCLPPICGQMPSLRYLHLPQFFGETLDLRNLPQLERVEGSASARLESVHAGVRAELDIDVSLRLCKVRVHRYIDGQLSRTHGLPGHRYTHFPPGASAPDQTQLNGVVSFPDNGQTIYCRHISRHLIDVWPSMKVAGHTGQTGFAGITSAADLRDRISSGTENLYYIDHHYSKAYAFVDESGFGAFAADQLERLMQRAVIDTTSKKTSVSYYLASNNHVTALFLTAKATMPPVFKAMLVDPNTCLARARIEANSLASIRSATRGWRLSHLIHPSILATYTNPNWPPLMYAFSPLRRSLDQRPNVGLYMNKAQATNSDLIYATMHLGLHELLGGVLDKLLSAYEGDGINGAQLYESLASLGPYGYAGLEAALAGGHTTCVRHYTSAIERLARVKTPAHLLNCGPGKLPDDWCEALLKTAHSLGDRLLCAHPNIAASVAELIHCYQRLFESRTLSAVACLKQLLLVNKYGAPTSTVIDAAVETRNDGVLSALGALLGSLHKSGAVSREQCAQLVKDTALLEQWIPAPPLPSVGVLDDPDSLLGVDLLNDDQADSDFSINW